MFQSITYKETAGSSIGAAGDKWTRATCPTAFTLGTDNSCYQPNFTVVSKAQDICNQTDLCKGFDIDTDHSILYLKTVGPDVKDLVPNAVVDAYVQVKSTNWLHIGLLVGGIVLAIVLIVIIIVITHNKKKAKATIVGESTVKAAPTPAPAVIKAETTAAPTPAPTPAPAAVKAETATAHSPATI